MALIRPSDRWERKRQLEAKAEDMHTPTVEARQHGQRIQNARENRGAQYALEHLRPSSGVPSLKKSYEERAMEPEIEQAHKRARLDRALPDVVPNRFEAIQARLQKDRRPKRYDIKQWEKYRTESLKILAPLYPKTNPSVERK